MKQAISVVLMIYLLIFCSCSSQNQPGSSGTDQVSTTAKVESIPSVVENTEPESDNSSERVESETTGRKISLQINGQSYSATLYETSLADALYDMLPLTVSFEDYNRTEKIGYLPDKQTLPTEGAADGFEPSAGDLCYYAPWGNLSLFYKGFRYSEDLYSIGHVYGDMSILSEIDENFTITFTVS